MYNADNVYQFPVASITNQHKFSCLKQQMYSSEVLETRSTNGFHWALIKVLARLHSLGISEENSCLCLLQLLVAACISWLLTPSSLLKIHHSNLYFCYLKSLLLWNLILLCLPFTRTHVIAFEATCAIQDNLLILRSLP